MINRNTRQNEQKYKDKRKETQHLDKKRDCFKSKLEQMEIAYSDNEAKEFYQEVNSVRKGFELQTLLMGDNKVTS